MKRDQLSSARLVFEITERIKLPPYRAGLGAPCRIPAPPFRTTLKLGDLDLNEWLQVLEMPTHDACGIFNEFVWTYLRDGAESAVAPSTWMVENSGIKQLNAWIFRRTKDPMVAAATYLWLCGEAGLPMKHSQHQLMVESDDGTIGFDRGMAVSPVEDVCIAVPDVHFVALLERERRKRFGWSRTIAFNRVWTQAHRHPEREALCLALAILYWRGSRARGVVPWFYPM